MNKLYLNINKTMMVTSLVNILSIILLFSPLLTESKREEQVWRNFQEFLDGGWEPSTSGFAGGAKGWSFPSEYDSKLSFLNDGVTGNGVWSSNPEKGTAWTFYLPRYTYAGVIEANLTAKYYTNHQSYVMFFTGCGLDGCSKVHNATRDWQTVTFPVNITKSRLYYERYNRTTYTMGTFSNGIVFFFDEIRFSYETEDIEDPNYCNESCEYRAIDCHNYYSCVNQTKRYLTCKEEDGLAFNPEVGMCDLMQFVEGCHDTPPPESCGCGYLPDLQNCSDYYYCEDTCQKETCDLRSCPNGLFFSVDYEENEVGEEVEVQQCTLPERANCSAVGK